MAHQRLGHAEQAGQWLANAVREIDEPPAERAKDPNRGKWYGQLTLGLLRQEAEALIASEEKKTHHKNTMDTKNKA